MAYELLSLSWSAYLVRGLVGSVFGIVAMVWPQETAFALVLLLGCWALADGAATIAQAFGQHGWGQRVGLLFLGALTLVAAFIAITRPGLTAATLTWILGIWLVVRGLFEISAAFFSRSLQTSRWILVLSGVVDGVIGVILMANPGTAALSIAFLVGLLALVWGLVFLGLAFAVRRREKGSASGATDAVAV